MSEIQLTGLRAGTPIGFLAALGAFRHAAELREQLGEVRLSWRCQSNQWCAVLATEREVDAEGLLASFVERLCNMGERPEFAWAEQIKKNTVEDFRRAVEGNRAQQEWFVAFGSELALSKAGTLQSTDLDMTGASQKFLQKLREASNSLSISPKGAAGLLHEALFGPWLYKRSRKAAEVDNSHSMGLDPSTVLQGAFTSDAPTHIKDKRGVRGAIWLAFEALPFFPCVYDGRFRTAGFTEEKPGPGKWKKYFEWGVWTDPLTMNTIRTMLLQSRDEWTRGRGISERFRSERMNTNQDSYSLAVAELVLK